jgi:hypothetical protein
MVDSELVSASDCASKPVVAMQEITDNIKNPLISPDLYFNDSFDIILYKS